MLLKPLRPVKTIRANFWTFDTETESLKGEKFIVGCIYQPSTRKGHEPTYNIFNSIQEIVEFLNNYSRCFSKTNNHKGNYQNIFVHNLTFDIRFLLQYATDHNCGISISHMAAGSKDLVVELTLNNFVFRFIDSVQLTLIGQQELEETLLKKIIKYKGIKFDEKKLPTQAEYVRRVKSDVDGLYQSLKVYFKLLHQLFGINTNDRHLISLSRLSLKAFRTKYITKGLYNPFCHYNFQERTYQIRHKDLLMKIYSSYFGGRTEINKRRIIDNAYCYDVNSLYPAMFTKDYPIGKVWQRTVFNGVELRQCLDTYEGFMEGSLHEWYSDLPILPGKDSQNRTVFSYGEKKGVYPFPEIRYGLSQSLLQIHYPVRLILFKRGNFFNGFGEDCFAKRKEFIKDNNPLQFPLKIIMNSLYGKFGQKLQQPGQSYLSAADYADFMIGKKQLGDFIPKTATKVHLITKGSINVIKYENNNNIKPFYMPHIASYVTSYARIELHQAMVANYNKLAYVDTDSLWTEDEAQVNIGDDLGEWKLEKICTHAAFMALKCYAYQAEELVIRIKGLSKKMITSASFSCVKDFHQRFSSVLYQEDSRYNTIKQSLIMSNSFVSSHRRTKEITGLYTKRKVISNGDTVPHPTDLNVFKRELAIGL